MVMETIVLEMEIIKQIIGRMRGPIIEGIILTKIMVKGVEMETYSENMRGPGPGIEVPQEIIGQIGTELAKVEVGIEDKGPELLQAKERIDQGLHPVSILVQIGTVQDAIDCNEYDHFTRECPNVMSY